MITVLALVATACTPAPNPDARFDSDEVFRVTPNTTGALLVVGAVDVAGLSVRTDESILTAHAREGAGGFFTTGHHVEFTAHRVGTTEIELLDGDVVVDTRRIEVVAFGGYRIAAMQGSPILDGLVPDVPVHFGVLENHGVLLAITPFDELGRDFSAQVHPSVSSVEVDFDDDPDVLFLELPESPAGSVDVRFVDEDDGVHEDEIIVVREDEIVSIDIDWIRTEDSVALSILGVTADGRSILGIDPTVTIDGDPMYSTVGSWLFVWGADPTQTGQLEVSWNGLTASATVPSDL